MHLGIERRIDQRAVKESQLELDPEHVGNGAVKRGG